uniref:Uncharacterized protein n=1 Tax=Ditylenchus dipsaci TaxID=166011 RepID=A0A915EQS0_9BILA
MCEVYPNVEFLKRALKKAWKEISLENSEKIGVVHGSNSTRQRMPPLCRIPIGHFQRDASLKVPSRYGAQWRHPLMGGIGTMYY